MAQAAVIDEVVELSRELEERYPEVARFVRCLRFAPRILRGVKSVSRLTRGNAYYTLTEACGGLIELGPLERDAYTGRRVRRPRLTREFFAEALEVAELLIRLARVRDAYCAEAGCTG